MRKTILNHGPAIDPHRKRLSCSGGLERPAKLQRGPLLALRHRMLRVDGRLAS